MIQQALLPEMKLDSLVEQSIELLRAHEPEGAAYYGAFSGGKDSVVIKELARMAGVRVEWHYHNTTIDPPELVRFIREKHPDVIWDKPKHGNFFHRAEDKGYPTRLCRWCCAEYKEAAPPHGVTQVFGVRAAESPRRAATWKPVTWHNTTKAWVLAPALQWSTAQVWEFIEGTGIDYCALYNEGFERLGCIGCPMSGASGLRRQFDRWPRFEALWMRLFRRIWEKRHGTTQRNGAAWHGDRNFGGWREMWEWWLSDEPAPENRDDESDSCQLALDMLSGGNE